MWFYGARFEEGHNCDYFHTSRAKRYTDAVEMEVVAVGLALDAFFAEVRWQIATGRLPYFIGINDEYVVYYYYECCADCGRTRFVSRVTCHTPGAAMKGSTK